MFLDRLHKTGLKIRQRLRVAFGQKVEPTAEEIRQGVLRRVESVLPSGPGDKTFPYEKIIVRIQPPSIQAAREFPLDTARNDLLETAIFKILKDNSVQFGDLAVSVEIREYVPAAGGEATSPPPFDVEFVKPAVSAGIEIPELHLEILKGEAEQTAYRISKDRLLVGSLSEVQDLEGRLVRKNNIVFPHDRNEINATVGFMHARIWFDFSKQEFRVMDESSRYGTRIVREGHMIEVPQENPRGVGLRTGDEVYFGQACIRLNVVRKSEF